MADAKRTIVVHQPDFIPYLGFFHRLLHCDAWVVLDHVQLNERGWVHRDQIKTAHGVKWLTLSLQKSPRSTAINERLLLDDAAWRQEHLDKWRSAYVKTPYFDEIWPFVLRIYRCESINLASFTLHSVTVLLELLDFPSVPMLLSSHMHAEERSNALMAELTLKAGGTHYLSGVGARDYYDPAPYAAAGVEVLWQEFTHPVYPQLHGEFVPYLTIMDLLFNCGVDGARKIVHAL